MTITTQYDTRDMLAAVRQAVDPPSFLQDLLVKSETMHDTDLIEIDVEVEGQQIPAYVSPVGSGEYVGKDGYSSQIHLLPYTKQFTTFTAKDLNTRLADETIYEGNPVSRSDMAVGKALAKFRNRNKRNRELQLATVIQTGKQVIAGKDLLSYTIDYQRHVNCTGAARTGDNRWGQSGETVIADMRAGQDVMLAPSVDGGYADIMLLGVVAARNFIDSDEITERLDTRRADLGLLAPRLVKNQFATYLGHFNDQGFDLDVWSYGGQYVDSTGTAQYLFNKNGMALINSTVRCETHFSMIYNFHSGNFIGREFPLFWISENGTQATIQLESGYVAATHEPNKIYYRQVGNG